MKKYPFAVFNTSGGGLVRRDGSTFTFIIKPNQEAWPGFDVGDRMPDDWGVDPANQLAEQDFVDHPNDFRSVIRPYVDD